MANVNKELRAKTNAELLTLVNKLKEQLLQVRFSMANGETDKLATVKDIRKTIARALTILNERKNQSIDK